MKLKKIWIVLIAGMSSILVMLLFGYFFSLTYHPVNYHYTLDGIHFTEKGHAFSFFGANSAIILKDGTIALYGIDFVTRFIGIKDSETKHQITDLGMLASKDGRHFKRQKITVKNLTEDIQTNGDATIVLLPDGNYRLYFANYGVGSVVSMYSQNGYDFIYEGKLEPEIHFVDPTIFYEKNAKKYYIYTRGENDRFIQMYSSDDGRIFQQIPNINPPFYLKFTIIDEGPYYAAYGTHALMVQGGRGVKGDFRYPLLAISYDALNWTTAPEQPTGSWNGNTLQVGNGAGVKLSEGGYILY